MERRSAEAVSVAVDGDGAGCDVQNGFGVRGGPAVISAVGGHVEGGVRSDLGGSDWQAAGVQRGRIGRLRCH